jgi:hypothetical protein
MMRVRPQQIKIVVSVNFAKERFPDLSFAVGPARMAGPDRPCALAACLARASRSRLAAARAARNLAPTIFFFIDLNL